MMILLERGAVITPVEDYAENIKVWENACSENKKGCKAYQNGEVEKALETMKELGRLNDVSDQVN